MVCRIQELEAVGCSWMPQQFPYSFFFWGGGSLGFRLGVALKDVLQGSGVLKLVDCRIQGAGFFRNPKP